MIDSNNEYNGFWANTVYGKELFDLELELISQYLAKVFGFNILQIGCTNINYLAKNCKINHKLVLSANLADSLDDASDDRSIFYSNNSSIPLATNSVDAVILAHALEFNKNPHAVLREVDRILLPDGHLIILGFNPWSLWGLRSAITNKQPAQYPWYGQWLSCHRICDWLNLLDYEVHDKKFHFFRPCIDNQKLLNTMRFFEQIGKLLPIGAAAYCINARKKQSMVTPLKAKWQNNVELVGLGNSVEPTMRSR